MAKPTARTVKSTKSVKAPAKVTPKARAAAKVKAPNTQSTVESILTNAFTAGYATADWTKEHKKEIGLVAGTALGVLAIQELL